MPDTLELSFVRSLFDGRWPGCFLVAVRLKARSRVIYKGLKVVAAGKDDASFLGLARFPFFLLRLLPLFDYVKEKRCLLVSLLEEGFVIDQSPRERTGVQKQQEQRECPRCRAAVARVAVLHGRWMFSCNKQKARNYLAN